MVRLPIISKDGFTLIEALFVLLIISIMMTLSFNIKSNYQLEEVIYHIETIIIKAHSYSLTASQNVYITTTSNSINVDYGSHVIKYPIPQNIQFSGSSFHYTPRGTISNSLTWHFKTLNQHIEIIFYLGSGHYQIKS